MFGAVGVCAPDVGGCRVGAGGKGKEREGDGRDGLAVHGMGWLVGMFQNMALYSYFLPQ